MSRYALEPFSFQSSEILITSWLSPTLSWHCFLLSSHGRAAAQEMTAHCCCCCCCCCCCSGASVVSDSVRPHRRQPTRLRHPWDSPDKKTGVGCHFLLQCMKVKSESEVAQSCPTPRDPMICSPPGSSIHGIFQARVLEWGAIAFSRQHTEGPLKMWHEWARLKSM